MIITKTCFTCERGWSEGEALEPLQDSVYTRYCPEEDTEFEPKELDVYDSPFDKSPTTITVCCRCCEDLLYDHSFSDFRYFYCEGCNRIICEQNPRNGWHIQYRMWNDTQICLACFEQEILENGIPLESFEEGKLMGMFFSYGNTEAIEKGWVEDSTHFVRGDASTPCNRAIELIKQGYKVLVAYESMAIGGIEGTITLMKKREEVKQ